METQICNSKESTSTSMKPLEDVTYPVQFSWIWSQGPWILFVLGHLANFSALTTLYLVRLVR